MPKERKYGSGAEELRGRLGTDMIEEFKENPFSITSHRISTADDLEYVVTLSKSKTPIRLALVSFEMPSYMTPRSQPHNPRHKEVAGIDRRDCTRNLVKLPQHESVRLCELYEKALKTALQDEEADIVCMNEFAFPARNAKPMKRARNTSIRLANDCDAVIIAGSYHDTRTMYNTGYTYYPGCSPHGLAFHKQVSATELGEHVCVPSRRRIPLIQAFGFVISVIVCLDLLDFSTVANVVKDPSRVNFLMVPAYSVSMDALRKMARFTSRAMAGCVAVVNRYHPEEPRNLVFFFGREPSEVGISSHTVDYDGTHITFYDIDQEVMRKGVESCRASCPEDLRILFGLPRIVKRRARRRP